MDPLICVNQFRGRDKQTLEIAALVASVLSYGRVENIITDINKIFSLTGQDLRSFTFQAPLKEKARVFSKFKHRFNDGTDIAVLFECVRKAVEDHGSLEGLFIKGFSFEHGSVREALTFFVENLQQYASDTSNPMRKSFKYLLPSPAGNSPCKRLNMFLRWMVRKDDGIDFGIWKTIPASHLVVPLDTHLIRAAAKLGLSRRKTTGWRMAEEITNIFKIFSAHDPVKYDFSLCRAGMAAVRGI
jgi:uncharacterized protein (TIGR02757 family)